MQNRTARDAGWHLSKYNVISRLPETGETIIVNLLTRSMMKCSVLETFLLEAAEELDENHPILPKFRKNGFLVNYDEKAALDSLGRVKSCHTDNVNLTICTTLACNFDCSYCFETKREGKMPPRVQEEVATFAERMIEAFSPGKLSVTWFGGEPLLAPDVIENLSKHLIAITEAKGIAYEARIITNGYLLTEENTDLLHRCRVKSAQITVDGIGPTHDATRHLAGGGGTFGRILANLTDHVIPFKVQVRQNIHRDNQEEMDALEALIRDAAEKSRNNLVWYPDIAVPNQETEDRGASVGFLERKQVYEADLEKILRNEYAIGTYCLAQNLCDVVIDEQGRLYKCWEIVHKPECSFGTAGRWDPRRPLENIDRPDCLTRYLNTACPIPDPDCGDCVWLPLCRGGCPHQRLLGRRACVAFKDDPDGFVQMLYQKSTQNAIWQQRKGLA